MSYDIELVDSITGEVLELDFPHRMRGGTYQLGDNYRCKLNVTYNYATHFVNVIGPEGIRTIYGMTGAESLPVLEKAIAALGDDLSNDYWEATEGNAKVALCQLRALAILRPDGIWNGD